MITAGLTKVEFAKFEAKLRLCVLQYKGEIGYSAQNAFLTIDRASEVSRVDKLASQFLLLTAEEEMAAAVIHAIKQKKYPNSSRLNHRNHVHKVSLWPIIAAILTRVAKANLKITAKLRDQPQPSLEIYLPLGQFGYENSHNLHLQPVEPFGTLSSTQDGVSDGASVFAEYGQEIASYMGSAELKKALSREANIRNQLLYASSKAYPKALSDGFEEDRKKRVIALSFALVGIMQTNNHQAKVTQAIDFLLAST